MGIEVLRSKFRIFTEHKTGKNITKITKMVYNTYLITILKIRCYLIINIGKILLLPFPHPAFIVL